MYQIDKQKKVARDSLLNPDTYFVTFCTNIWLLIAVLVFFFNTRLVGEEYFIRNNIEVVFE